MTSNRFVWFAVCAAAIEGGGEKRKKWIYGTDPDIDDLKDLTRDHENPYSVGANEFEHRGKGTADDMEPEGALHTLDEFKHTPGNMQDWEATIQDSKDAIDDAREHAGLGGDDPGQQGC